MIEFFLLAQLPDETWNSNGLLTWTIVEPGVYLIAATLPFMRPLLRRVFQYFQSSPIYNSVCENSRPRLMKWRQTGSNASGAYERPDRDAMHAAQLFKPPSSASSTEMSDVEKPSAVYLHAPSLGNCRAHRSPMDDGVP